ncbi:MAG TPA: hypothetical protein ENF24_02375 [Methanosarcinales archaeon]|nr:hypothetical protein [Methanosarcinales archaeon]
MTTMQHHHTKNTEDLIRQIESDDELSKEFEDAKTRQRSCGFRARCSTGTRDATDSQKHI